LIFFASSNIGRDRPRPPNMALTQSNGYYENSIPHSKEKDLPDGGNWVVQKFGGTSIGKCAASIGDIIE
jgi:hypothetical protein